MNAYKKAHSDALSDGLLQGTEAEARAIVAGADAPTAAHTGIQAAGCPVRHVGPNLTDDRTVAVNAQGKRLPHNARGIPSPGSTTRRGKDRAHQRTRGMLNAHAAHIDRIRHTLAELDVIRGRYSPDMSRKKRKGIQCALRAVNNRLQRLLTTPAL